MGLAGPPLGGKMYKDCPTRRRSRWFSALSATLLFVSPLVMAAQSGTEDGQWRYLGGDSEHTRYLPADQINAENFNDLEEAWIWDGASFAAQSGRSTPSYIDGVLYTVAGPRRHVVAIDPANGETLWSYREPHTARWEYSMRKDYGKGIAYAEM